MPWKFIFSLAVIVLATAFIGFNLGTEHICSIWFFKNFTDVPVFMPVLISFVLGCLFSLFCILAKTWTTRKKSRIKQRDEMPAGTSGISFSKSKKTSQEIKDQEIEALNSTIAGSGADITDTL